MFEREHHFVQTGMCFPERFVAFEPTSVAKARDNLLRSFGAFALSITNDPCSIAAAVDAGGDPAGCRTGEPG
jgi:hypothetical protein